VFSKVLLTEQRSGFITSSGLFTIEDYENNTLRISRQGLVVRRPTGTEFIYLEDGIVTRNNMSQIRREYLDGKPTHRIAVYESNRRLPGPSAPG
jgi:hypothetical protein